MLTFKFMLTSNTVTLSWPWLWVLAGLLLFLIGYFINHEFRRKRSWRILSEKLSYLDAFLEGEDGAISFRDRERRLLMWNKKFAESIRDFSGVEIKKGMRAEDYVPAQLYEKFGQQTEKMMAAFDGEIQVAEYELPNPEGPSRWLETRWTPVIVDGECVAVTEVSRDISGPKNMLQSLRLSERRFDALLKNSSEAIYCIDLVPPIPPGHSIDEQVDLIFKNGYVSEANMAWVKSTKFESVEDIIGQPLSDVVPASNPDNIESIRRVIKANYNLRNFKTFEPDKDGNIHVQLNNVSGDFKDGHLRHAWGTSIDITELEEVMHKLRMAEEKYRSVVELCNEAIFITQDTLVKYCNPFGLMMTGYSEDEIIDKVFLDFIHPDDKENTIKEYQSRLSGEKPLSQYTIRILTKNNEVKTVIINSAAAQWEGAPAVITLITDVSEMKSLEKQLHQQNERVARMERISIFGQLTGAIAHELNQPLTGVLSNAQAAEIIKEK